MSASAPSPSSSPSRPTSHTVLGIPSHWVGPIGCLLGLIIVIALLMTFNATAREIGGDTAITLFTVFTTPFILEATSAFLLLIAVLAINRWRLQKEGDDWVYLVSQETEDRPLSPSATQRLQSQVLTEKPELADETETEINVLEGYLELGMPSQALAELHTLSTENPAYIPLRLRILSANLQTDEARQLLQQSFEAHPQTLPKLVQACLESARWLLHHLQRRDLAALWLNEAQALHPLKLSPEDPLSQFTAAN